MHYSTNYAKHILSLLHLSLLTPYTGRNDTFHKIVIQPQEICNQAARAILDLTVLYEEIFTPGGLSDLLPHFVSSAISFLEIRIP